MNDNTIGKRLAMAMIEQELPNKDLADKVTVTPYTIGAIRRGMLDPDPVMLGKIADAIGLPMDFFTTEDDDKAMAYLRKDGQVLNGEWEPEIKDTEGKLDQVMTSIKAMFYDFLTHMYMDGRPENEIKIVLGLMNELTGKLSGAVKDM